jgi:hypothetical protein
MKKVIFSAIAMMAFVGTSMANTIEVEVCDKITMEDLVLLSSDTPCADAWSSDVDFFQDYLGVSLRKAMRLADLAFEQCLDDVYGAD